MAIKVKAKTAGTYGKGRDLRRYDAGETFTLPDGVKPGKWMEVISTTAEKPKAKVKEAPKEPAKEPTTFSELSKVVPNPKTADLI